MGISGDPGQLAADVETAVHSLSRIHHVSGEIPERGKTSVAFRKFGHGQHRPYSPLRKMPKLIVVAALDRDDEGELQPAF